MNDFGLTVIVRSKYSSGRVSNKIDKVISMLENQGFQRMRGLIVNPEIYKEIKESYRGVRAMYTKKIDEILYYEKAEKIKYALESIGKFSIGHGWKTGSGGTIIIQEE
jgi:hypothetical protein